MLAGCALVASCDSGSAPTPTPTPTPAVNQPPVISSATTASVSENSTGTAFQVIATDPEGRPLSYTLSGADAARFTIGNDGAIRFVTPPDFEAPADADANNVYVLSIAVSDGQSTATGALSITVVNEADQAVFTKLLDVFGVEIDQLVGIPASDDLFLVEGEGRIFRYTPPQTALGPVFMTVGNIGRDTGVQSMALAPDFATSGTFYIAAVTPADDLEVRRYASTGGVADPASADVILRIAQPSPTTGDGRYNAIAFGPGGDLYVLTGANGDGTAAQNPASLLGKVLRIDVSGDAFPADPARDYRIPADNPAIPGGVSEVYALGVGSPQEARFEGSNLLFGDGALNHGIELLRPQDKGSNYGFGASPTTPPPLIAPVIASDNRVTGGLVYRGPVASMVGYYIFGGGLLGVERVPASQIVQGTTIPATVPFTDLTPDWSRLGRVALSFAEDSKRNLYMTSDPYRPSNGTRLYRLDVAP